MNNLTNKINKLLLNPDDLSPIKQEEFLCGNCFDIREIDNYSLFYMNDGSRVLYDDIDRCVKEIRRC